jgi:RTX calcium-binding nonapeptide repeat (4 copies)/WD40-like Beta Propeller Repeat
VKLVVAALVTFAALSAAGAAAPQSPTCCTADFDPQWSQDGSRIAFVRLDPSGVSAFYTVASTGGDEHQLVSLGDGYGTWQDYPPLLSPDWTKVALIAGASERKLKIENVGSNEIHEIGSDVFSFAWSPDGRQIAFHERDFANNTKILVVNSDGSGLRTLAAGQDPAWSPHGARLAFVGPDGKLYAINADGSGRRLVYDGNGTFVSAPSWSPQGDRIALFAFSQLVVISSDGAPLYSASVDYDGEPPKWSPDGALIAVEALSAVSIVQIGNPNFLSFLGRSDPSWSPEENFFAASFVGPCQRNGIYRMAVRSASQRLTLDCHIRGTSGSDVLTGSPNRDIITGFAGDDELLGADGEDRLIGGPGDDTLLGGNLADRLEGGYGADLLIGGNFQQDPAIEIDDRLIGGPGPDDLRGGPGSDSLTGGTGNDVLRGGTGEDSLYGGPGNDRIFASGDPTDVHLRVAHDFVACGGGRHDVAYVDRQDHVSGCETVHRR